MMGLLQQAALPMLRSLHAWAFEGKLQGAPGDIFISGTRASVILDPHADRAHSHDPETTRMRQAVHSNI